MAVEGGNPIRDIIARPWPAWPIYDEAEERALLTVLHSGKWWYGEGAEGRAFEKEFAAYQGAQYGAVCASGTAALEIALRALEIGCGDEVIIPAYTFIATASAILTVGATPIFADIDPDTLTLDASSAASVLTPRTRAIVPVHVAGRPADLDALLALARSRNLPLIEDAAQAHGAAWRDMPVGALGTVGTFSFQASKNLNGGEGGIVLTNDAALADRIGSIINVGRSQMGSGRYAHPVHPGNARLGEFQSAVLRAQLTRLPAQTALRQANAAHLRSLLAACEGVVLPCDDPRITSHAYHLFTFRCRSEQFSWRGAEEIARLLRAEGLPCSPGYAPLYREPPFANYAPQRVNSCRGTDEAADCVSYTSLSLPKCEQVSRDTLWLPQTLLLGTHADMEDIAAAIIKVQQARR